MAPNEPWDLSSDTELYDAVRDETHYTESQLPTEDPDGPDLTGLVDSAKRVLALKADVTSFYDDRGITMALHGISCAKAKGAVENQPVRVKNLAGEDVTFRTTDGSSLQVEEYEEMTRLGLAESEKTDKGTTEIRLTRTFLHE